MNKRQQADKIVKNHVVWSMGGGLIPFPIADVAAVTAIQMGMLEELAKVYGAEHSKSAAKRFTTALAGGTMAKIGASLLKIVPGVGTVVGAVAMSGTSGASTYALGQVAIQHFETGGSVSGIDMDWAKNAYEQAFEKGKKVANDLETEETPAGDPFEALTKLKQLHDAGVISEEAYETKRQELLDRI